MSRGNGNGDGFEGYSYSELLSLQHKIAVLVEQKKAAERTALREKLTALARKGGFEISELVGGNGRSRKHGKVAPRYADPSNPDNTWTGRGRMPRWMATATKGGKISKDDFLIR